MEIKRKGRFYTKFYGSAPANGYKAVLASYIEDKVDKDLLSWADQQKKKAQTIDEMITEILSVFHRNEKGHPVLGGWMVKRCCIDTGMAIFNAAKNKDHPPKQMIPMIVSIVEPHFIPLRNGKLVTKSDGIDTYAVTIPTKPGQKGRSFFKAYEYLNPGTEFEFTASFDDDLVKPEIIDFWLEKCGFVGVGAFRERFGKFEYPDKI